MNIELLYAYLQPTIWGNTTNFVSTLLICTKFSYAFLETHKKKNTQFLENTNMELDLGTGELWGNPILAQYQ